MTDPVKSPPHYNAGGIECIDALRAMLSPAEFIGFLKGNIVKYLWRSPHKGARAQDVDKAGWYRDRLAEAEAAGGPGVEIVGLQVQVEVPDPAAGRVAMPGLRPEVLRFALAMEARMAANDHKGGREAWRADGPEALMRRVLDEHGELLIALRDLRGRQRSHPAWPAPFSLAAVLDEAADVANFAMMVADAAGALGE